jgi:D-alanine-D-alanine ligase
VSKLRVAVIYGGRSGEHEVSVVSASSIVKHLNPDKYEVVPIRIDKQGRWLAGAEAPRALSAADVVDASPTSASLHVVEPTAALDGATVDVVFPVLHGPYGEDGTVQGLLELANVPYVGAGVLGSAVGMDKGVMKTLFLARGLPVGPYHVVMRYEWDRDARGVTDRVARELRYPVFVKPANLGSSVGISKARSDAELVEAMTVALQYDRKIVIETAIPQAREIECAVLGNDDPRPSVPGEIIPSREFYDYEAKYLDDGVRLLIPAPLAQQQIEDVQRMAVTAFRALDLAGLSRVDFLMAGDTGELFINEVNTMPGFTTVSMYPKMWEASGLAYPDLLDRLITLARERHAEKQRLRTSR